MFTHWWTTFQLLSFWLSMFALFYLLINARISHVIITLIRYFIIPKSRDLVSHNSGISGLKNGPDCNPYLWRNLCKSLLYFYCVYNVVVKKVHVRYLISWWVSCIIHRMPDNYRASRTTMTTQVNALKLLHSRPLNSKPVCQINDQYATKTSN